MNVLGANAACFSFFITLPHFCTPLCRHLHSLPTCVRVSHSYISSYTLRLTKIGLQNISPVCRLINPRRTCAAMVTVVGCVCLLIPPDQYTQCMRELNDEQRSIVMFHRDWRKKAVLALKQNKPVEPYHVFLSGPGSVGKAHVFKLIHWSCLNIWARLCDYVTSAPTGVAAFNIDGMTLHSA